MAGRYLNPYTDFGFKKLFGEEASKDLLQDFLNELLPPQHRIATLSFQPGNRLPDTVEARSAVFDIFCQSASGERFIVEMQQAKQNYFKDRTVFYATFPIRDQAPQGDWNFHLKAVYCIGILDFEFEPGSARKDVLTTVELKDQHNEVFYDKLTFLYFQMPNFTKTEVELVTHFDKWLYFLKHLATLEDIPAVLRETHFEKGFALAEVANLTPEERLNYERSLMVYRDLKNVIDTARDEGREEGREEGRAETLEKIRQEMLAQGLDEATITRILRLPS